ncbi:MAG: phospholipid carrier-dependent glycosyltransferase [Planctomycetia bacterium]|nr:phospholipid carrier-dependent glycosyltransferase [Planctomycetia bacterium]
MKQYFKTKSLWFLLLIFALFIRIMAALAWEQHFELSDYSCIENQKGIDDQKPFFFGDSDSYWTLGRALAFSRPYQHGKENWTIFRMPGYPLLLMPLFWFGGENPPLFWARLENAFCGMLTVALVGCLGFLLFRDQRIALLAAFFAAVDPCSIVESILVLAEEPFVVTMLLQLICFVVLFYKIDENNGTKILLSNKFLLRPFWSIAFWTSALGLTSALTVYFRPDWFYFMPFVFLFMFVYLLSDQFKTSSKNRSKKRELISSKTAQKTVFYRTNRLEPFLKSEKKGLFSVWRQIRYKRMICVVIGATVVFWTALLPWILRNERLTGRFIPTTLQMGASLYDGLNPNADGSSNMNFVEQFRLMEQKYPSDDPSVHFEVRLDRRFKKAAWEWIRENPQKVLELAVIKFLRLWNFVPNEPAFSSTPIRIVLLITYLPLLILGIIGAWGTLGLRSERPWDSVESDCQIIQPNDAQDKNECSNLLKSSKSVFVSSETTSGLRKAKSVAPVSFDINRFQYQGGFPYWLLWLPALYITLLHIIFVSSIRYRTPAMFGIMILAAATIIFGVDYYRTKILQSKQ